jgi:hypothetical protein
MASWREFEEAAPYLAGLGRKRFDSTQLAMLGTLRKDGFPRVTPIEYTIYGGEIVIGGMWQSKKCLDLERDGRCVLHSTTSDKAGEQGDSKLSGRAVAMDDAEWRKGYCDWLRAETGWAPDGPFHAFRIDITEAAYVVFGDTIAPGVVEEALASGLVDARLLEGHYAVLLWRAG